MKSFLFFFIALYEVGLQASQVNPFFLKKSLGITIQDIQYPSSLKKDLQSGLTHRFQFVIRTNLNFIPEINRTMTIKYDLWNEKYQIALEENVHLVTKTTADAVQLNKLLNRIQFKNLISEKKLSDLVSFSISVQIKLNPIEKERAEAVKKWVAENSLSPPVSFSSDTEIPKLVVPVKKKTLFSWIFDQNTEKLADVSEWQSTTPLIPIRIQDIPYEN